MGSIKHDSGKRRMTYLLELEAFKEVVKVLELGERKYGRFNFRESGFDYTRLSDAALRHMEAFIQGEDQNVEKFKNAKTQENEEASVHHLACAVVNLLFILEQQLKGYGNDDRAISNHDRD